MTVRFFTSSIGNQPVRRYLDRLETEEAAHVMALLQDLAAHDLADAIVAWRQVRGKLYELKIRQHRIFVVTKGRDLVLLHAYKKQKQQAPKKEIETACRRMEEVLDS